MRAASAEFPARAGRADCGQPRVLRKRGEKCPGAGPVAVLKVFVDSVVNCNVLLIVTTLSNLQIEENKKRNRL